jgi:alkylation response protein AidB-like acyl-CoA dehydrogenase
VRLGLEPELEAVRARTRALIDQHGMRERTRAGVRAPEPDDIAPMRKWAGALYEAQLLGVFWPVEYGGLVDAHPLHEAVVNEELARAGAPTPVGGGQLAAAAIIEFGTTAQKDYFLPRIRSGEHIWCQLFSEPGAGSDLASLRTRARLDGDRYIIDGQKVWTTNGQYADWGYLLARTDPDARKHQGISAFALNMRAEGVDVRPLREITGTTDFNEVFLDAVEVTADNVIGALNGGWAVTTASLAHERSGVGGGIALFRALDDLFSLAAEIDVDGVRGIERHDVRQALGGFVADSHVSVLLSAYGESRALHGSGDVADAPLSKIFFSEVNLALAEYGMALQGANGIRVEGDHHAHAAGWWQDAFLYARAYTIAGGANEVLRNLVAERGLGLPKG